VVVAELVKFWKFVFTICPLSNPPFITCSKVEARPPWPTSVLG
jgi:hypothetical protein